MLREISYSSHAQFFMIRKCHLVSVTFKWRWIFFEAKLEKLYKVHYF